MRARSKAEVDRIRRSVAEWRRLSDRLFSIGNFGVGLDGLLTLVPGLGGVYGLGAGGFLLLQAHRARASKTTLIKMGALLGTDALLGEVPIVGDVFDFLFRAHARSARMLLKHIDATHFADDSEAAARAEGRLQDHHREMKARGARRMVFLRD